MESLGFVFGMTGFTFGLIAFVNVTAVTARVEKLEKQLGQTGIQTDDSGSDE